MKLSDFLTGVKEVEVNGPKVITSFTIPGIDLTINLTETIVVGWIVILILLAVILFLTHNMQVRAVTKRQAIAEMLVETVENLVDSSMGKKFRSFAPYIATIFVFSCFGSLISLIGLRPVTGDFNTTFCWGLMTFVLVERAKIKTSGIGGFLKGFFEPIPLMLPLNLLSEAATPVSMGFRHFGNVAGGMIITSLLYFALTAASTALGLAVPVLTVGIPALLSVYFDLFTGFMQAFIFFMLTMAYLDSAFGSEE